MKKYFKAFYSVAMLMFLGFAVGCKTEVRHCTGCCDFKAESKTIVLDEIGTTISLQFHKAITPVNYDYCEYYSTASSESGIATWVKDDATCLENPDKEYNNNKNDDFEITGNDPVVFRVNGFRTQLEIRQPNDTTPIWSNDDKYNYGESGSKFIGEERVRDIGGGVGVAYPFASGLYEYTFYIYDTLETPIYAKVDISRLRPYPTQDEIFAILEDSIKTEKFYADLEAGDVYIDPENPPIDSVVVSYKTQEFMLDSVAGFFCLIRNEVDCPVNGCSGQQEGDQLLK